MPEQRSIIDQLMVILVKENRKEDENHSDE